MTFAADPPGWKHAMKSSYQKAEENPATEPKPEPSLNERSPVPPGTFSTAKVLYHKLEGINASGAKSEKTEHQNQRGQIFGMGCSQRGPQEQDTARKKDRVTHAQDFQ